VLGTRPALIARSRNSDDLKGNPVEEAGASAAAVPGAGDVVCHAYNGRIDSGPARGQEPEGHLGRQHLTIIDYWVIPKARRTSAGGKIHAQPQPESQKNYRGNYRLRSVKTRLSCSTPRTLHDLPTSTNMPRTRYSRTCSSGPTMAKTWSSASRLGCK